MNSKPLPIWPMPLGTGIREALISAKQALGLDFLVIPVPAFSREFQVWRRVTDARVLAFSDDVPGLCDHALIRDHNNKDNVIAALDWVLSKKTDDRAKLIGTQLAELLPGVKEIPATQVRYENLSKNMKLNDGGTVPIFR
jgi:hypothetical protein